MRDDPPRLTWSKRKRGKRGTSLSLSLALSRSFSLRLARGVYGAPFSFLRARVTHAPSGNLDQLASDAIQPLLFCELPCKLLHRTLWAVGFSIWLAYVD